MRSVLLTPPVLLVGVLLLTACGPQQSDSRSDRPARVKGDGSSCEESPSGAAAGSGAAVPPGDASGLEKDGVKIVGLSRGGRSCAEFEVTNHQTEPFSYTITFAFLSGSGEALENPGQSVASVMPGETLRRTVTMSRPPSSVRGGAARVRIAKVRSVPTSEAPSPGGPCPPSGLRVYTDDGDAAMGLRAVGLHLENCGTRADRLDGYPQLQLLDEDHRPVDSVKVLQGGDSIATGTGADGVPQPLTLQPGERARATLVWRNTVEAGVGDPVHAPYVRAWAKPDAVPVTVTPELDLGTTGKLGVGPWKKDDTNAPGQGGTAGAHSPEAPSGSARPVRP
ncbi:DUF4232 domain-containing protein [Streptomyces cinnamoneus]|uniref:DUF4232 domain-containing protein n=1 Tax=Streptomyces cinnamoneus TaxID=53446 RepID=UPI0037A63CFE